MSEERKHHYLGYLPMVCEVRAVADPDPRPRTSCPFGWSPKTCSACPYVGCPARS
jgi:hypothetical protein